MKEGVRVFPCGVPVITIVGSIEGLITAVVLRYEAISYEITYFYEGEQMTVWLTEHQFFTKAKKKTIGYKQSNGEGQ